MPNIYLSRPTYDRLQTYRAGASNSAAVARLLDLAAAPAPQPPAPAPAPAPVAEPFYLALVVPRDRLEGSVIKSPVGDYSVSAALGFLATFGARMNAWARPSGDQFRVVPLWIPSRLTLEELQRRGDGSLLRDEFGLGVYGTNVLNTAPQDEASLQLAASIATGRWRAGYIVVGGGRVDAGATSLDGRTGYFFGGDEDFSGALLNVRYPGMDGADWWVPFRAKSHEMLHALGCYCHAGDWFDAGEFAVNVHEQIDPGFTSFPLQQFKPIPQPGTPEALHLEAETRLYAGQAAQWRKFSAPFVAPA